MKIICVDAKTIVMKCSLKEEIIYTVRSDNGCGQGCCYEIVETGVCHKKYRFIPCSEIDELELQSKREYELVKL